mmetsp:Transcript_51/g.116  ORF Transcript_51/g.116 Transcript_51/m.116 type:complete len:331 (+) Transcript_51:1-993(+)
MAKEGGSKRMTRDGSIESEIAAIILDDPINALDNKHEEKSESDDDDDILGNFFKSEIAEDNRWERVLSMRVYSKDGKAAYTPTQMKLLVWLLEKENRYFWVQNRWGDNIVLAKTVEELDRRIKVAISHRIEQVQERLYRNFPLKISQTISLHERNLLTLRHANFNYSEVGFFPVAEVLWNMIRDLPENGIFYDLGSGSGRVIFSAAMLHDFKQLVGIEKLNGLLQVSREVRAEFNKLGEELPFIRKEKIVLKKDCILEADWSDGDVVFVNCAHFDHKTLEILSEKANRLKKGAVFITTTYPLLSSKFELRASRQFDTEHGFLTMHVQTKM